MRPALTLVLILVISGSALAIGAADPLASSSGAPAAPTVAAPDVGAGAGGLFGGLGSPGAIVIGAGVALAIAAASLFFLGGAKFVNSENVLENAARKQIFEHVQAHPGIHLRAAAQQLSLSTTNVLWHLRKLEDANLVTSKKFEGYKVFYPVEGGVETKRKAIALSVLKNDNASQILEYVNANPSAHQREIARAIGVNHGTIRWHLRKLEEAQLVMPMKREHTTHYYLTDLGKDAIGGFQLHAAAATAPLSAPPVPPTAEIKDDL